MKTSNNCVYYGYLHFFQILVGRSYINHSSTRSSNYDLLRKGVPGEIKNIYSKAQLAFNAQCFILNGFEGNLFYHIIFETQN